MELRQLEYFVNVVEHGSFTRAAKHLFVSQSALSKSVKKLEEELGIPLFCQVGQNTVPTDAGAILYEKGKMLLTEAARTKDLVSTEMQGKLGRVRIALSCKRAYYIRVGNMAARFKAAHPNILLEFTEASPEWIKDGLMRHTVDVGFIGDPLEHVLSTFDQRIIAVGDYRLAVHKDNPLAKKSSVRFSDLANENWIEFPSTFHFPQMIHSRCERAGFHPHITTTSTQPDFMFALVNEGQGISMQPWPEAEALMGIADWPNVVMLPVEDLDSKFALKLLTLKDTYISPAVQAFVDFMGSKPF